MNQWAALILGIWIFTALFTFALVLERCVDKLIAFFAKGVTVNHFEHKEKP
jgi:hypothetical protein